MSRAGASPPPDRPINRGPGLEAPGPPALDARQAAQPLALAPDLDHQVVGGLADAGVDDLGQVDPEQVGAAAPLAGAEPLQQRRVVNLDRPPGQA